MSLYAKYLKEREDLNTIERNTGFICYKFEYDYCYITDIYVLPEYRQTSVGQNLEAEVIQIALKNGIKKILGSVDTRDPNFERNHKVMLARNYKEVSQNQTLKIYMKEI